MRFDRLYSASLVVISLLLGACESARAQPGRESGRASALAAHAAEVSTGKRPRAAPAAEDGCLPHELAWQRGLDVFLCASACTSDADCDPSDRCRVLDRDKPNETSLAADRQDDFRAADAERRQASPRPLVPGEECEEECDAVPEVAPAVATSPLAVCDPFHDVEGALWSAAEEEADAQGRDVDDAAVTVRN